MDGVAAGGTEKSLRSTLLRESYLAGGCSLAGDQAKPLSVGIVLQAHKMFSPRVGSAAPHLNFTLRQSRLQFQADEAALIALGGNFAQARERMRHDIRILRLNRNRNSCLSDGQVIVIEPRFNATQ